MNRYIFGLVLVQTLPYLNIIPWDPNSRWWLHEPLLAAFCLPVLPVLWRSKIIPKGYWIFVAWTALTILYTPQQPKVAIGRFLPALLLLAGVCYLVRQIKTADDVHRLLDGFLRACAGRPERTGRATVPAFSLLRCFMGCLCLGVDVGISRM